MAVFNNILAGASGATGAAGYEIERSLRFNSGDSAYLNRTPSSAGNRKTWTWSGWVKLGNMSADGDVFSAKNGSSYDVIKFESGGLIRVYFQQTNIGQLYTVARLRDPSAWYHLQVSFDTTQSTSSDRFKIYINGDLQILTGTYPGQNDESYINGTYLQTIGRGFNDATYFNGYLADVHFIDGQALAPTDFGEYDDNNVWQPKEFTGTYGWFDQSQTWSGLWSTTGQIYGSAAILHDATVSSSSYFQIDNSGTFTLPSALPVTSLRFWTQVHGTGGTVSVNGTDVTSQLQSSGIAWSEITGFTSLSSISVTGNQDGNNLISWYAIELNGKVLIDSGITGIADNSFYLNFSDNSSNAALGTDSSGNSNDWTVNNLKAVDNFGISSAASITSLQTISFPITYAATVTYEFFVQVTNAVTYTYFAEETSASVWNVGINASGDLLFGNYTGGWTTFSSTGLADGSWHFVRLTTTGSSTSLYKDGTLLGTNASGGNVATSYSQITNRIKNGAFKIAHLRITTGGTPPTTGIPAISSMNQAAGTGGTLVFYDALDDIASSGTKTSDGGNVTITMAAATAVVSQAGVDSLIDTPTNYEASSGNNGGNYCTMNPLAKGPNCALSNGNLDITTQADPAKCLSTIGMSSGKWYSEFTCTNNSPNPGLATLQTNLSNGFLGNDAYGWVYGANGKKYHNDPGASGATYGASYTTGDVIGVAFDAEAGDLTFYKNGTSQGAAYTGLTSGPYFFATGGSYSSSSANFGQRPFAHTPPTGFLPLVTTSLPDPTIADGSTAFDVALWTGNGSSAQTISTPNLSPDLVWYKERSSTSSHGIVDSVRGATNAAKVLYPDRTDAEATGNATQSITSLNSDGFTIGSSDNSINENNQTYVGWAWDAGTSNTPISAGGLNSSAYNQSVVWSNGMTVSSGSITNSSNAFNGDLGDYAVANAFSTNIVVNLGNTLDGVLEVYGSSGSTHDVNGQTKLEPNASGWHKVGTCTSGTTTTYTCAGASNAYASIRAIRVAGKILVDQGTTPAVNVPSIASTVRANPSAGFSIVKYALSGSSAETIGHGLNAPLGLLITKCVSTTNGWAIWHSAFSSTQGIAFTTGAVGTQTWWDQSNMTSSVFAHKAGTTSPSGADVIAYCFAPVEGYSAFGSYTGNGSTDGPFVYTGFRPRWLMVKSTGTESWGIWDAARNTFNLVDDFLLAQSNNTEQAGPQSFDFLSNGFKVKSQYALQNTSGQEYLYMCFAEHPFKTARAR